MDIPKEIRQRFKPKPKPKIVKSACYKQLGELYRMHDHLEDGTCVLKNWSNSEVLIRK